MKSPKFDIFATFMVNDSCTSLCEISEPLDAEEFFVRLKAGFLQWRRPLSNSMHSLSICAKVQRRDAIYRDLIQDVCALWNADPEIAELGPSHIEFSLSIRNDNWIGCTTATDWLRKIGSEQGDMHFVDYAQLMKDMEAQLRKQKNVEKSRRRANPVKHPVELPTTIKSEIASYLRLEYGESARDKGSVKARDLTFDGEFVVDGVPTQFWRYPTSNPKKPCWATVERFDDLYCLGMTDVRPPKE